MVKNTLDILKQESIYEAVEYIKQVKHPKPVVTDDGWWDEALNCIELDEKSLCLEFGVFTGESINYFSNKIPKKTWYGFDSFEGLQEHWPGGLRGKGWFNLNKQEPKVNSNVVLVKGWFKETLPKFLKENKNKISFIHIDCDTYQSTKDVFDNIQKNRFKKGARILFDDYIGYWGWKDNVFQAWKEYVDKNNISYHYEVFGTKSAQVVIL